MYVCVCIHGLLWWLSVKDTLAKAGDSDLIPDSGKSPEEGNDNPFEYSCLENSLDRGAWWVTAHGVTKNWTHLSG